MSFRSIYLVSFLLVCGLIAVGFYTQFVQGIMPCPLCYLQRFALMLLGLTFLIGVFIHRRYYARMILNIFLFLFSLSGLIFAGRQVWLQHFPPLNNEECGVSLHYMMQVLPWKELAQKILAGSAECTQVGWRFLGLNMAEWSTVWFALFLLLSLYLLFTKNNNKPREYLTYSIRK